MPRNSVDMGWAHSANADRRKAGTAPGTAPKGDTLPASQLVEKCGLEAASASLSPLYRRRTDGGGALLPRAIAAGVTRRAG
jgi:hypothetical protein